MALHIDHAQMERLGQELRGRFERDCVRRLREQQPDKAARHDDATLLAFVQHGVARAARVRVDRVSDVVQWLELMLLLGPRFDEDERLLPVQRALADPLVPAVVRLAQARSQAAALLPQPDRVSGQGGLT